MSLEYVGINQLYYQMELAENRMLGLDGSGYWEYKAEFYHGEDPSDQPVACFLMTYYTMYAPFSLLANLNL